MELQILDDKLIVEIDKQDEKKSEGGIILTTNTQGSEEQELPHDVRIATVIHSGKKAEVEVGEKVLIELRWTNGVDFDGGKYKVIFEKNILGVYRKPVYKTVNKVVAINKERLHGEA